jgi:hypothetical protein
MPNHESLLPETKEIIDLLENQSGFPVTYVRDENLSVLATIKTGTPSSPIHVIRFRPDGIAPDYQISVEVGYALRTFNLPPEKRFHLSAQEEYRNEAIREVQQRNPQLSTKEAYRLGAQVFDGLLLQLRSCAVGILVDLWIYRDYPGLRLLQANSLEHQARENTQCLAQNFERALPKKIVAGNRSMNAAHALFIGDLLNKPHLAIPYRAAGFERIGTELLSGLTNQSLVDIDDQALILDWAKYLGIENWIKWLPFD